MFDKLVGQKAVKNALKFHADGQNKTMKSPFMLLVGEKGVGKTHFARSFGKSLVRSDGRGEKKFAEINSSTISSTKQFLETLYVPSLFGEEVSVLFDECHALPKKFVQALLTIMEVGKGHLRTLRTENGDYDFNFKELSFIFATTEPDQMFEPLKSRMERVDFARYTLDELGQILALNTPDMQVDPAVMVEITKTLRGNARNAVKMAQNIDKWGDIKGSVNFDKKAWINLKSQLGILPYGLSNTEVQILQILKEQGDRSLQMLVAATGMSRQSLQKDIENYLLACGFIDIKGTRRITQLGRETLEAVEKEIVV